MTVALYARVSSDDQADRETIKDQILLYEKWIDLHGHQDGGRYLDDGVTGTLPMSDRPGGSKLLEAIKRREVSAVAFKNVKRLGRKTRVVLDFIESCDQAGATITSITEPFSTADAIGRFIVTILASISELDRENILEQTRAGMRRRAREGGWLGGKCAYGYRIEGKRHQAHLVLGPESEQQLVREIFQELAKGGSCDAMAIRLTAQGVPSWSGKCWSAAVVSRMIQNPVYRGQHRHGDAVGGSVLPVTFSPAPRIVEDGLWQRANDQIEKNRRLRGRAAKRLYLLRGLLWCGECGHAYTGLTMNPDQADATDHAKGIIYRCNWRAGGHRQPEGEKCSSPSMPGSIEADVWRAVSGILQRPQVLAEAFRERIHAPTPVPDLTRLQTALADREEQRARILSLYRRGTITETELDEQIDDLMAETEALRGQLEALRMDAEKIALADKEAQMAVLEVETLAETLQGRLESLTREERSVVINALVEKIVVEKTQERARLRIRFRFDRPIQHEGQINLLQQMVSEWNLPELEKRLKG
jgi:site-specific DNA recombinase